VPIHFCTLFDARYAARGIVMLESLEAHCKEEKTITILAVDDTTPAMIEKLGRPTWTVMTVEQMQDAELLWVRRSRPHREFCWTCAPALMKHMVAKHGENHIVVYLDADLYFFASPHGLLEELKGNGKILIHEHRYSQDRSHYEKGSGRFNVGFVAFVIGDEASSCTNRWRQQALDKCVLDPENGFCGDQGYLNEWPELYSGLRILQNIGGGVAPWNLQNYVLGGTIARPTVDQVPLVFFHYHSFRTVSVPRANFAAAIPASGYELSAQAHRLLFAGYWARLQRVMTTAVKAGFAIDSDVHLLLEEAITALQNGELVSSSPYLWWHGFFWRMSKQYNHLKEQKVTSLKRVAVRLLPPLVTDLLRRIRSKPNFVFDNEAAKNVLPPEWEAIPETNWITADGWLHPSIVETQVTKWPEFVASIERPRALGVAHEALSGAPANVSSHNIIMTFGYVLGRAIATNSRRPVRVLDWGGGLGHYARLAQQLFPEEGINYTVCELPLMADAGRKVVPEATFVADRDEALSGRYDLIYASSSLQYVRDFYGLLEKVVANDSRWIMICRMPFVDTADDFVVVQRPRRYGYDTEYTGWFLNRRKFIDFMQSHDYRLEREFLNEERPTVVNAPEQCAYRGFLFQRRAGATPPKSGN